MKTVAPKICALLALAVLGCAGCTRQDTRIMQHARAFDSLRATTTAIANAWLAGSVSGTYTRTAFEQTYQLVEQERSALAASPQSLVDARGAQLSQSAEHLSRLLAQLIRAVGDSDPSVVRRAVSQRP